MLSPRAKRGVYAILPWEPEEKRRERERGGGEAGRHVAASLSDFLLANKFLHFMSSHCCTTAAATTTTAATTEKMTANKNPWHACVESIYEYLKMYIIRPSLISAPAAARAAAAQWLPNVLSQRVPAETPPPPVLVNTPS